MRRRLSVTALLAVAAMMASVWLGGRATVAADTPSWVELRDARPVDEESSEVYRDCGSPPLVAPDRHQSRVANLTLLPRGKLRPLRRTAETAEYFQDPDFADQVEPSEADWQAFDNIELSGDRRDIRWNYIDESGLVYQLVTPSKSQFHQPDTSLWNEDGSVVLGIGDYLHPPVDRPESYPNRKLVTFPDRHGRSFEIVLLPDRSLPGAAPTFTQQTVDLNTPSQGTFNWADEATRPGAHVALDVAPHRDEVLWPNGDVYQPIDVENALRPERPDPGESLYRSYLRQRTELSALVNNLDRLQKLIALGDDLEAKQAIATWPIRIESSRTTTGGRYRLVDRNDRVLMLVDPAHHHALERYLVLVGLDCGAPADSPIAEGSPGADINAPAPCRDPNRESPLSTARFFPSC